MKKRLALVLLILFALPPLFLLLFALFGIQNTSTTEVSDIEIVSPQTEDVLTPLKLQDSSVSSTTNSDVDSNIEFDFPYDLTLYSDAELIRIAEGLDFRTGPWPKDYDPFARPEIDIASDNYIDIAKEYVRLFNEDKWGGAYIDYNGLCISVPCGELKINDVDTGVRTNERIFYDIVKELYDREVWNGKPATLGTHTISLNEKDGGYLLVDDYTSACNQRCLDLPASFTYEDVIDTEYIAKEGVYVYYEDQTVIRYVRGKVEGNPAWVLKP